MVHPEVDADRMLRVRALFALVAILASGDYAAAATYKCKDADGNWSEQACAPKKVEMPAEFPVELIDAMHRQRARMDDVGALRVRYHAFCAALTGVDIAIDQCVEQQVAALTRMNEATADLASGSDRDNLAKACFSEWYERPLDLVNAVAWRGCYEPRVYP